MQILVQ